MRIRNVAFLMAILSAICGEGFAQELPLVEPGSSYTRPKEIPKPLREDRLKALLPIVRGIYSNTDKYFQQRRFLDGKNEYTYFERIKPDAEEVITLQNLDDIATVVDYLQNREANSKYIGDYVFPKPHRGGFYRLWPDDINFVLGPGLKGCDNFCRRLLIEKEFVSITVLETEMLETELNPQPFRAVKYSLDDGSCERPNGARDLEEGQDETLNIPDYDKIAALPTIGLCFQYKPVDLPKYGAFVYFNQASPFWPNEAERTLSKKEIYSDGTLLGSYRIIDPKAFEDLETEFSLSFIHHMTYEYRYPGLDTKRVFALESACIRPHIPLSENALNLLVSSHQPSENFIRGRYHKYLFVSRLGICIGNDPADSSPHSGYDPRMPFPDLADEFDYDYEAIVVSKDLSKSLLNSIRKYEDTGDDIYYSDITSILHQIRKDKLSQDQIDILMPVYEAMFINFFLADEAIRYLAQLPEGSLAGHVKSLNRIRDIISEKSGCNTLGCDGRYDRFRYNTPSGTNTPEEKQWLRLAVKGASIYSAAGPKAIKHLEKANDMGLGGGIYAMGCMGTYSDLIAVNSSRNSYSNRRKEIIKTLLSLRHGPQAQADKEILLKKAQFSTYDNSQIRALLAWDNKSSICAYSRKFQK
jgi:hypothetical protein